MPNETNALRIFSGGAPQQVLRALTPEIEKSIGRRVDFTFALVSEITRRLADGELVDLVLLPVQLIDVLGRTVALRPDSRSEIARVGIGVIVREDAPRPDISNADAVSAMLLAARNVALPDPSTPSGSHLARVMVQLGIAEAMASKSIHKGAIHGGGELVARGEADVGLYLVSEVRTVANIAIVGLLPPAVQSYVVYGAAIPASNAAPEDARAFIRFVTDPARAEMWRAGGFELAGC